VSTATAGKPEPKYIAWKDVEREKLNPLIDREMITGQEIMVARVFIKKGGHVPLHHHHNEQLTYILEGALKFAIDGKEIVVRAGEVLCIPSNMPHEAWGLEDTLDLDVFTPPREDWLNKTDDYLRKGGHRVEPAPGQGERQVEPASGHGS
jgi:quercetin dioxygenase-like cupin family protein